MGYPDIFRGSSQVLQTDIGIVPWLGHDRFLSRHFQFIFRVSSFDTA